MEVVGFVSCSRGLYCLMGNSQTVGMGQCCRKHKGSFPMGVGDKRIVCLICPKAENEMGNLCL